MGDKWEELPTEIMVIIVQKLSLFEDFLKLSAVCKSWKSNICKLYEGEKPPLPLQTPLLLLAEQVAQGAIVSDNDDYNEEEDEYNNDDNSGEEEEEDKPKYDHSKNSVGNSRDYFSISSEKTYTMELPEAAGRLILGTNKGWLITLGRDLQINLLHPFLRHQIPLPPMPTLPIQYEIYEDSTFSVEDAFDMFLWKVVLSSVIPAAKAYRHTHQSRSPPIVMAIYGERGYLAFTELGDKVWTEINAPTFVFDDIVYHKQTFYAIDCHGDVYMCDIKQRRATKISSIQETYNNWNQKYLVESSSGSHLFVVVRFLDTKPRKYQTTDFTVWKLELIYSDSSQIPSCTWNKYDNLGNDSIFIGKNSSVSISSSDKIKSNCIYFTDDATEYYWHRGGGHDMGIFSLENRTVEPHFKEKSIHPISPPLWFI